MFSATANNPFMKYDFKIRGVDDSDYVPHPKVLVPMSASSFASCALWLSQAGATGTEPNADLLTMDLRYARIAGATAGVDQFGSFIAFRTFDRNPRLVTPAQFCFMRLLALPGGACAWYFESSTKKRLPPDEQRYYPKYGNRRSGNLSGLRILYDAQPGEVIRQRVYKPAKNHRGHYDLRPHNIWRSTRERMLHDGKPMREPYRGRIAAIDYATTAFGSGFEHLPIDVIEYRDHLLKAADYVDETNIFQP